MKNQFFKALGLNEISPNSVKELANDIGIPYSRLKYYNSNNILPSGADLQKILQKMELSREQLMLRLGKVDKDLLDRLIQNAEEISKSFFNSNISDDTVKQLPRAEFQTHLGSLYRMDCLRFLQSIEDDSIDLIFADPPFNLDKEYPSQINDKLHERDYISWCEEWTKECVRVLKHGGSLFIWNLPKWNTFIANILNNYLTFRHWISVDIKYSLPIANRLYPSHYSLLYYCKGEKPSVFHPDRIPMPVCPKCQHDLRDYGGYKSKMNPMGLNLPDVWTDISPVRHAKYKRRNGSNELPIKLLDRIIEMSSNENDIVLDPFGGSGTTFIVSEIKNRRWIGCEIGPLADIVDRFSHIQEETKYLKELRKNLNKLFTDDTLIERERKGLWTPDSIKNNTDLTPKISKQIKLKL